MDDSDTTNSGPSLTLFLLALCHSSELLEAFRKSPSATASGWGLTPEQIELLQSGNLQQIEDAVRAELPAGTNVYAAIWVDVVSSELFRSGRRPDWWLFF